MPIIRTPWIDDDGTGTTGTIINNAEKTILYDQIDALAGATLQVWTPVDASGAGLTLTGSAYYVRLNKIVFLMANVVYPSTANGAAAAIGGLPFPCDSPHGGVFQAYGVTKVWWIQPATSRIAPYSPSSGGAITNAAMSGANDVLIGFYQAL